MAVLVCIKLKKIPTRTLSLRLPWKNMSVPVFFRDEDSIRRCFIETWTCSITQQSSRVIAACHPDWRDVCKTLCHGNGHIILRLIVKPEIEVNPLSGIHRSINTVSNILKQKIAWHDLVAVSSLACTWMKLLQPTEKWNCLFFFPVVVSMKLSLG